MKSLYKFLLGLSVIFIVACGPSYEKNPHLSKIDDDVTMAKNQIENKTYTVTTNDLKVEEKEYGNNEEKLIDDILHIRYNSLPIYQIIFDISTQLDSMCDAGINFNELHQAGSVFFIWLGDESIVTLTIPIAKRNNKYVIMELSELSSSGMKKIDSNKKITSEEKEMMKELLYYKLAWYPTLHIVSNKGSQEVSLQDIKSLDEIRDLVESLNHNSDIIVEKNIFEFVGGNYEISEYSSVEFLKEIMKANESYMLPFPHMAGPSIESVSDGVYFNLGADRAIIDGAAGNKIGAYLSVTYYKNDKQLAVLYFMLDEELVATQDVRLEFSDGKELNSWDIISYSQK